MRLVPGQSITVRMVLSNDTIHEKVAVEVPPLRFTVQQSGGEQLLHWQLPADAVQRAIARTGK